MNVKVYYKGLGWYSGRVQGATLVYSPGREEEPEHPNIYLLMKESASIRVARALDIKLELVSVL